MSKLKIFFTMVKYEVVKIMRNKLIFLFLLLSPLVMTLILNSINAITTYSVAIYLDNISEQIEVLEIIEQNLPNDLQEVASKEEGMDLVKKGRVFFFVELNSSTDPITATFYYDGSNNFTAGILAEIQRLQIEYSYEKLTTFLNDYGITINESQFNLIEFESTQQTSIGYKQRLFPLQLGVFLSILIMLGLTYSISRDNETGVDRQISYTPIKINEYLLSKATPYIILSIFQALLQFALAYFLYSFNFLTNFGTLFLVTLLFIFANVSLGLLTCLVKNQTTSAFLALGTILLPLFAIVFVYIEYFPIIIQSILYLIPLTSYILLLKCLAFNGVTVWFYIILLILQIFVYYIIVYLVMKKRTGK